MDSKKRTTSTPTSLEPTSLEATSLEPTSLDPLQAYLDQMGPFDKVVLEVAKRQLGMSFDMKRSIGFLDFMKDKK